MHTYQPLYYLSPPMPPPASHTLIGLLSRPAAPCWPATALCASMRESYVAVLRLLLLPELAYCMPVGLRNPFMYMPPGAASVCHNPVASVSMVYCALVIISPPYQPICCLFSIFPAVNNPIPKLVYMIAARTSIHGTLTVDSLVPVPGACTCVIE